MNSIGLAELKAHLSAYLRKVKSGQEVLITERGVPVARLVPLEGKQKRRTRREKLAREEILRMGKGKIRSMLRSPPKGAPIGESVLSALLSEREEGR